jgi:Holliday junction DNA helicase RuvA
MRAEWTDNVAAMIGWLRGRLHSDEPGGPVILDVGGVGYELNAPLGSVGRAHTNGDQVEFFVHTHVREDALDLYGFANETERRVFRLLLGIPNVGPKTAIGVLSALSVEELAAAVQAGNLPRLSKVPGIGKKTAERLVLELRDKLEGIGTNTSSSNQKVPSADARGRLLSALTNMGYRSSEAEKAVAGLGDKVEHTPLGELLKEALARLG